MLNKKDIQEIFEDIARNSFKIIDSVAVEYKTRLIEVEKLSYLIIFAEKIGLDVCGTANENNKKVLKLVDNNLSDNTKKLKEKLTNK